MNFNAPVRNLNLKQPLPSLPPLFILHLSP